MKKGITFLIATFGIALGMALGGYIVGREVKNKSEKVDKFKTYYNMLNQWLILKQEGKNIENYFLENGYKTIAIYGMGEIGHRFFVDLFHSLIKVKYAIDRNASSMYSDIEVVNMDSELESVDAIVVSAVFAFDDVKTELKSKLDCDILSLEELLCDI